MSLVEHIYEQCRCVIVYLGDRLDGEARGHEPPEVLHFEPGEPVPPLPNEDREDLAAYRVLCLLQELGEAKHLTEVSILRSEHRYRGKRRTRKDINDQLSLIEALRKMTQSPFTPWWSRIWTVQEIAVVKNVLVVYGTMSAPWSLFARAAGLYVHHSMTCCSTYMTSLPTDQAKVLADCCNRILGIEELQEKSKRRGSGGIGELQPGWSLLDLLPKFRDRRATDPRDKVYALLSLIAKPHASPGMVPDYTLSETEVFGQATLACIYGNSNLSVFSTELGRKFRNDLPSWVPDWGAPGSSYYETRAAAIELYSASPSNRSADAETLRAVGGKALSLDGFYLESVVYTGDAMVGGDVGKIWRGTLENWWKEVTSFDNTANTSFRTGFWRLICGDIICNIGTGNIVRRAQFDDELAFTIWAMSSEMSPNMPGEDFGPEDAKAWQGFASFWAQWACDLVPKDLFRSNMWLYFPKEPWNTRSTFRSQMLRNCLEACGLDKSDDETGLHRASEAANEDLFNEDRLDPSGHPPEDALWSKLFIEFKRFLTCRIHHIPDMYYQRGILPVIDRSIMTATHSRRLIKSGRHIGLGPANARVGDKIFFLSGGKTPFVLRETDAEPTIPGPKFEIIGDCYLQGAMDWERNPVGYYHDREKITLV